MKDETDRVRKQNKELIEDMCYGCCPSGNYCTLKEIMMRAPRDARTMVQIKCIEKMKYERSKGEDREVDWNEASRIWVNEGYASLFAKLYREGMRVAELYDMLVK